MLYINQFPKEKTAMLARFVSFVAGAFAGILALLTIYDQELLLGFEISPDKTVFFYIGVFGTILAVARGMIPDENIVFDPEHHLLQVMEHTHYYPEEWKNRLHSDDIRRQFSEFFDLKVSLFLQEFTSVLFTPLALWFSLPSCSEQIVDFFREFTVQVDGLGYVCSFSLFDFERHGNPKYGAPGHARSEYYVSKQGKMEKSFINFKAHNPDWEPEQASGSVFLQKVQSKPGLRKRAVGKTPLSKSVYNQPLDSITEHDMMHLAGLLGTRDLESDDEVPEQNHWGEGETEASTSNVYSLMNQFYNPRDDRM
jgi:autophagy-related protein 9